MSVLALLSAVLLPLSGAADQPQCTPDRRVCLQIVGGEEDAAAPAQLVVTEPQPQPGTQLRGDGGTIALPPLAEGRETLALWGQVIPIAGNAEDAEGNYSLLVGVVTSLSTMYSGGGGQAQRLHLFRLRLGIGTARLEPELFSAPLTGSVLIRACFAEADSARRRGACHDDYRFDARLGVDPQPDPDSALPRLTYTTRATAYPRTARRMDDSSAAPPLRAADLAHWRDPVCSYTRTLRYNPPTERYEMDRPAS